MPKEMEITITPDGTVQVLVKGVKGKKCVDLVKFLEVSIGEVKEKKLTLDYYEKEVFITEKATQKKGTK